MGIIFKSNTTGPIRAWCDYCNNLVIVIVGSLEQNVDFMSARFIVLLTLLFVILRNVS